MMKVIKLGNFNAAKFGWMAPLILALVTILGILFLMLMMTVGVGVWIVKSVFSAFMPAARGSESIQEPAGPLRREEPFSPLQSIFFPNGPREEPELDPDAEPMHPAADDESSHQPRTITLEKDRTGNWHSR